MSHLPPAHKMTYFNNIWLYNFWMTTKYNNNKTKLKFMNKWIGHTFLNRYVVLIINEQRIDKITVVKLKYEYYQST